MRSFPRAFVLASVVGLSLLVLLPGCGLGTAGVVAATGGNEEPGQVDPVATALQAPRSATSPATVSFLLVTGQGATANAQLQFRTTGGGAFQPVTLAAGSAGLSGIAGSSSTPYSVLWDFAADLGGAQFTSGVELRLAIQGGNTLTLANVSQGNDAPQLTAIQPAPFGASEYVGNTDVSFEVADSAQDPVSVRVEFNPDRVGGFPDPSWQLARPAATPTSQTTPNPQINALATSIAPAAVEFRWDTVFDLDGFDEDVLVRITLTDSFGASTAAISAVPFRVDNNLAPIGVLQEGGFVLSPRKRGVIPVPFQILDTESDAVRVAVQFARDGESFPTLPTTASDLLDLLDNPARGGERRVLQIATEARPTFTGRVGFLPGLGSDELRLPELASSGAHLLAAGIGGGTLEILRNGDVPAEVVWASNPLSAPVAAIAGDDVYTALVLDQSGSGWRLRTIDLETGAVVRTLATGAGIPRALSLDPEGQRLFVGTHAAIHRLDRLTGLNLGFVVHSFVDGPRGLAAMSANTVVATGDDRLIQFDLGLGTSTTLLAGLATPFGVVRDPLDDKHVYFAERDANRVLHLDLDRLVPHSVSALVAPQDQAALGAIAFPSPRGLALELDGSRLLVFTEHAGASSLRALPLRTNREVPGSAPLSFEPLIDEVVRGLATTGAAIGAGPDRLRLAPLSASNTLAIGGGVFARRPIVPEPAPNSPGAQPTPYDPARQVVRLAATFEGPISTGTPWRLVSPSGLRGSPEGTSSMFRWDSRADVGDGEFRVRIVPLDADLGAAGVSLASKQVSHFSDTASVALTTGSAPASVAAADLNGDGRLDLVSADTSSNRLSIFFQASTGAFPTTASIALNTGSGPRSVVAADLNGDGQLDLVSADSGSNRLSVFFQIAAGIFPASASLALDTGSNPRSVVAADLNGDGRLDLVSPDDGNNRLSVFFQAASGGFLTTASVELNTGDSPAAVAAADLNGDGRLDLVSADLFGNSLSIFFQGAPGIFPTAPNGGFVNGENLVSVLAADLNGDGRPDLVAPDVFGNRLSIFFQTAPGEFRFPASVALSTGNFPSHAVAADFNGDGRLDLVSVDSRLSIFFQTTSGVFPAAPSVALTTGSAPAFAVAADLNNDGRLDLVSADSGLSIFFQAAPGVFPTTASAALNTANGPTSVVAADLNSDGRPDLVSADFSSDRLSIFFQTAQGVYPSTPSRAVNTGIFPSSVVATDLSADGRLDLISADRNSDRLTIFRQTAPGVFPDFSLSGVTTDNPKFVVAADLNGDGRLDLVSVNQGGSSGGILSVFFQNALGGFSFEDSVDLFTGVSPNSVAAADLNGDGRLDLVSADGGSDVLSIFFQGAPGNFPSTASAVLATGDAPESVMAADLDGDGRLDLASADAGSNGLSIFFQAANGGFPSTASAALNCGDGPRAVVAADLNGDGRLDLASADFGSDRLSLFLQTAPGEFPTTASAALTTGTGPRAMVAADLDGDGLPDLVSADNSNRLSIFFNH
jgi:hypothetical protein